MTLNRVIDVKQLYFLSEIVFCVVICVLVLLDFQLMLTKIILHVTVKQAESQLIQAFILISVYMC